MKRASIFLLGTMSLNLLANELSLLTDISRATGEVRVYIKNDSDKQQSVLTRNLTIARGLNEVTLSPEKHVLVMDRTMITLKEDLAHYGVVHLEPGEITYINNPNVNASISTVKYEIATEWGEMHKLWTGKIEALIDN